MAVGVRSVSRPDMKVSAAVTLRSRAGRRLAAAGMHPNQHRDQWRRFHVVLKVRGRSSRAAAAPARDSQSLRTLAVSLSQLQLHVRNVTRLCWTGRPRASPHLHPNPPRPRARAPLPPRAPRRRPAGPAPAPPVVRRWVADGDGSPTSYVTCGRAVVRKSEVRLVSAARSRSSVAVDPRSVVAAVRRPAVHDDGRPGRLELSLVRSESALFWGSTHAETHFEARQLK